MITGKKWMKKLRNNFKDYRYLLIVIGVGIFCTYGIFLFTDQPFFVNNDQYTQFNIYFEEFLRLLEKYREQRTADVFL